MKSLINFFLNNSLVVNLLSFIVLLVGTVSAFFIQKDMFPDVSFDILIVTTAYPGSTSEDVEKLVSIPLERKIKAIDGIDELNVMSAEGSSVIWIQVDPDYQVKDVLDDLRAAVDSVNDLPTEAKTPVIMEPNNSDDGFILIPLAGKNEQNLRVYAKMLRDELELVPGVSRVDFSGYRDEEIRVEISTEKLNNLQLTIGEVAKAIQGRNLNLSAGKIQTTESEIMVRTVAEFATPADVGNVVVRSNANGFNIQVKDIGKVSRTVPEGSVLVRSNGEQAIFLEVKKRESADIIKTTDKVKAAVKEFFEKNQPPEIVYRYTDDQSYYVKRRLSVLTSNGFWGLVLVFFCLTLFLNFRTSLLTSFGAPLAFMSAFAVMDALGITLNLISMFGLILVLGMLVDDAIILAEHYYQNIEKGMKAKAAAAAAAFETIKPITATILTTMVAFSSLFFMGGIMGKFTWPIPAVVILCLAASWLECFFILPNHLADFGESHKKFQWLEKLSTLKFKSNTILSAMFFLISKLIPQKFPLYISTTFILVSIVFLAQAIKSLGQNGREWYRPLIDFYHRTLSFCLKRSFLVVFTFFILLILSAFRATKMPFELFPGDDVRLLQVTFKGPVGVVLAKTDDVVRQAEQLVMSELQKSELDQVRSWVGSSFGNHGSTRTGTHYGSLIVYLTAPDERVRTTDLIVNDLNEKLSKISSDYEIEIKKMAGGPPKGNPVDIELASGSLEDLKSASALLIAELKKVEGIIAPSTDFEEGKQQFVLSVNDAEASRLGLTTQQVAFEVRRALAGDAVTEIRESDEDIEIVVMLDAKARSLLSSVENLFVLNNMGQRISLSKLVKFSQEPGAFVIRRKDGKRTFSVLATIDKEKNTPVGVAAAITPHVQTIVKSFPGMTYSFGGEREDTNESMVRLVKAIVISLFSIFFILVVMLGSLAQPLLIMSAIPLGFIGVILSFNISMVLNKVGDFMLPETIGFLAVMGMVGLLGVVVNDSIVLVDVINKNLKASPTANVIETIISSSISRFRAVLLTTITTVCGLLPIALDKGGDPFLKPMAWSFAGGLAFATAVTLVFIPCLYHLYTKMIAKKWFNQISASSVVRE